MVALRVMHLSALLRDMQARLHQAEIAEAEGQSPGYVAAILEDVRDKGKHVVRDCAKWIEHNQD